MCFGSSTCDTNPKESHCWDGLPQTQVENPVVTLGSSTAHLWHDFYLLIPTLEGQGEDLSAPIGHGGWLAVNHQVYPVGLRWGRLGVLLRTDHVEGLRNQHDRGRWGRRRRKQEEAVRQEGPRPELSLPLQCSGSPLGRFEFSSCQTQVTSEVGRKKNKNFREKP